MPAFREGWSLIQDLDLRVGAIEFLRVVGKGSSQTQFFKKFWSHWVDAYGVDSGEIYGYEEYENYRERVFSAMCRHIFGDGVELSKSRSRTRRIRVIRGLILVDLSRYEQEGLDYTVRRRSFHFDHFFDDNLRELEKRGYLSGLRIQ